MTLAIVSNLSLAPLTARNRLITRWNIGRPCIEVRSTRLGYEVERARRIVVWGIESVLEGKPLGKTLTNLLKSFFTSSAIRDKFR